MRADSPPGCVRLGKIDRGDEKSSPFSYRLINNDSVMIKKFGLFAGIAAYIVGLVGGIGYALYGGAYFIALCVAVLGGIALPTVKKWFHSLLEG